VGGAAISDSIDASQRITFIRYWEMTMNFNPTETYDSDDCEVTATYGTAVFVVRAARVAKERFESHRGGKAGHLFEHGEYNARHPMAA
jgi:hypothetical protein